MLLNDEELDLRDPYPFELNDNLLRRVPTRFDRNAGTTYSSEISPKRPPE